MIKDEVDNVPVSFTDDHAFVVCMPVIGAVVLAKSLAQGDVQLWVESLRSIKGGINETFHIPTDNGSFDIVFNPPRDSVF